MLDRRRKGKGRIVPSHNLQNTGRKTWHVKFVRFEVVKAAIMKSRLIIVWDLIARSRAEIYERFKGKCCLHLQVQKVSRTSKHCLLALIEQEMWMTLIRMVRFNWLRTGFRADSSNTLMNSRGP
jgi:hypothetical protein